MSEPSLDLTIQPQIRPPQPAAATSSPVSTASTPGAAGAALVDAPEPGMGMGRAHEVGVDLARSVDVVSVPAAPGDEALVFLASDRGPDAVGRHGLNSSSGRRRR